MLIIGHFFPASVVKGIKSVLSVCVNLSMQVFFIRDSKSAGKSCMPKCRHWSGLGGASHQRELTEEVGRENEWGEGEMRGKG